MEINISKTLRPIRIAWLVDPYDKNILAKVMSYSSFLWGGFYNPIIPVFNELPESWQDFQLTPQKLIDGYIDAFDPDVIVDCVDYYGLELRDRDSRKIISLSDIYRPSDKYDRHYLRYGIPLFPLLKKLVNKEFKYTRNDNLTISLPIWKPTDNLFLTSVFGAVPEEFHNEFLQFADGIPSNYFEKLNCSINDYMSLFTKQETKSYQSLSSLDLEPDRMVSSGFSRMPAHILLLDSESSLDLIDFWNLRAAGRNIKPICSREFKAELNKSSLEKLSEELSAESKEDPWNRVSVGRSRSLIDSSLQEFQEYLKSLTSDDIKFLINNHFPRIYDEFYRSCDHIQPIRLKSKSDQESISVEDKEKHLSFKGLSPDFDDIWSYGGREGNFVNEIQLSSYSPELELAEAYPLISQKYIHLLSIGRGRDVRTSKTGIGCFESSPTILFQLPTSEKLFSIWLKSLFEDQYSISFDNAPNGIARTVRSQLVNLNTLLMGEGELVHSILKKQKYKEQDFRGLCTRLLDPKRSMTRFKQVNELIEFFLEKKIFRLALEVQCRVCNQHSSYAFAEIQEQIVCKKCARTIQIDQFNNKSFDWVYLGYGPFATSNETLQGCLTSLLTLRFFQSLSTGRTPLSYVFDGKIYDKANDNKEITNFDLSLISSSSEFSQGSIKTIFVESKTSDFKEKDFQNINKLSELFPDSIFVYATLKRELSKEEVGGISRQVNSSRLKRFNLEKAPKILVLTGNELFSYLRPPACWDSKKYPQNESKLPNTLSFQNFVNLYGLGNNDRIDDLCEATQELYLGIEPRDQAMKKYYEQKSNKPL